MWAFGWPWDSDLWSLRCGLAVDMEESGAERYSGNTMAAREPWWLWSWKSKTSPASPETAASAIQGPNCKRFRNMEIVAMSWVHTSDMSYRLGLVQDFESNRAKLFTVTQIRSEGKGKTVTTMMELEDSDSELSRQYRNDRKRRWEKKKESQFSVRVNQEENVHLLLEIFI